MGLEYFFQKNKKYYKYSSFHCEEKDPQFKSLLFPQCKMSISFPIVSCSPNYWKELKQGLKSTFDTY